MESASAPSQVKDLVERFDRNLDAYRSGQYNETQVRIEFIDPLFEALGWDVQNRKGYAEAYKDVIHEDAIKVGGVTKAPDYCFRVGGTRKFFLEAKKPSISIKDEPSPAYQLRRYAWSAKLPLSVLTDFEEFAVYDCRIGPAKTDKPSAARTAYFDYTQYEDSWDEIAAIFSRDAILKGSFDKYVESTKAKRGTAEVDAAFLKEIEAWRESVARNIALRNPDLSQRELNFAVQRTIDRIIFLRICEDRGIEPYGRLMALLNGDRAYPRLCEFFRRADERYNSGLFHFGREKGRTEPPDEMTLELSIDDKPLKDILKKLYYPDSPYEFSVLPADILGQVYEQFLGKVIRLTAGHRAVVEDKPEVKKAGGVYYTPTYIVDYIVGNTVGKLLEGKTARQADRLRILDPACGSGSFLIGAYQHLLDWYRDWYAANDPEKWAKGRDPRLCEGPGGDRRLTTAERKRILLNNIHGVDIDSQAVEVTKLSLLLKVLEGETQQTLGVQLRLFHERVLPDLANNIKCGNSLIGPDFYENQQMTLLDEEERYRINVFDWHAEFPVIFGDGGFDVVLGNPPYVDIKGLPKSDVDYVFRAYPLCNNRVNLFAAFMERCLGIVKHSRFRYSMIVPTALLTQDSYRALRCHVVENYHVAKMVRLPNESFGASAGDVKVDTAIFAVQEGLSLNREVEVVGYAGYDRISEIDPSVAQVYGKLKQSRWADSRDCVWSVNTTDADEVILSKCEGGCVPLVECAEFCLGLTPYDKYKGHTREQIKDKVFHCDYQKDETYRKLLAGNDVRRYIVQWNGGAWISYGPWLGAPREQRFFAERRILVKQIIDWTSKRIWATITDDELYNTQNAFNLLAREGWSLEYLLGILNSRLMTFYHRKRFLDEFKMRFQKILIKDCKRFPMRAVDHGDAHEKSWHSEIVALVNRMLALHERLGRSRTGHERTAVRRQIEVTDSQIDQAVYELYGLTQDQIKIVEGATLR